MRKVLAPLAFPGSGSFFALFAVAGSVLVVTAISAYLTPSSALYICGYPCVPPAPAPLQWTAAKVSLLLTGVLLVAFGMCALSVVYLSRRSGSGTAEPSLMDLRRARLRSGTTGLALGGGLFAFLGVAGTSSAMPNGGGLPLLVGSGLVVALGATLLWRGYRVTSTGGMTARPTRR